ncbi:cobalamin B12-binding domain-containing protein [Yoonia sp.]|uniref:cobalamin B12-binding domain-containing protein n=1 Tax=Yoonia sp. TaxID=2212373 RepID=UPI003F6B26B3
MADCRNIDATAQKNARNSQTSRSAGKIALAVVQDVARHLDPVVLSRLRLAALGADKSECTRAMHDVLANGVRREDMADFYIPELARQLGEQWCSDELGFVGVTIGVSRLQAMLRDLGPEWSGDQSARADAPSILLIVPQDAHHTLGAMVLAGQLRRKGYSVRLMLGLRREEVATRMKLTKFQAVFVSASQSEKLETLRRIVDVVKTATLQPPLVVIGGSILEVETEKNLKTLTGADHATKRPDEALRLCGLRMNSQDSINLMRGT